MDNRLEVIGNSSDILCYNLNKQFCNIKKLVITSDVLLKSFDSKELLETFVDLSHADESSYSQILKEAIQNGVFTKKISSEASKYILERLQELFNEMNVELQNYNFMSSINNTRFNVTLRCENFAITKYFQEKNALSSIFTQLLVEYLTFEVNEMRNTKISKFQIEITISEDIFKHIYLKKEGNKLLLVSAFGFKKGAIHDYGIGAEFYISEDEEFHFYKNSQNYAILRDQTKLKEQEIHEHEKILSNDELILLNKNTKNIDDVLIEMYINPKGTLRITNISILEHPVNIYSKEGFVIYKSTNNYNKISLITLRDEIDEETPNPKYLLIKNHGEIQELFEDLRVLRKIDGLIFTINFYSPILELFGEKLNIDIIFVPEQLQRCLETTINWENFSIEGIKKEQKEINPFGSIMKEKNHQKDEMLERLKNVDLSTPNEIQQQKQQEYSQVSSTTQNIISSPQSQENTNRGQMDWGQPNTKKKSALSFLADAALNGPKKEEIQQPVVNQQQPSQQQSQPQYNNNQQQSNYSQDQYNNNLNQPQTQPQYNNNQQQQSNYNTEQYNNQQSNYNNTQQSQPETQSALGDFNQTFNNQSINQETKPDISEFKVENSNKYDNILATKLITPAQVPSENVFADQNTMQYISRGNIHLLVSNVDEMNNNSLEYILPLSQYKSLNGRKATLLLNSPIEFFMLPKEEKISLMINLNCVPETIMKEFLDEILNKENIELSIMCDKEQIFLLENKINKIKSIFVQNIQQHQEFEEVKNKVLTFEKKWLMKNL